MALFRRHDRTAPAPKTPAPESIGPPTTVTDEQCAPAVGTSWLQYPTLAESGAQLPLKGTSFHQRDIAALAWAGWEASPATDLLTVQLAVVPSGQWAGAVGAYAAGARVGSIPADLVDKYRPVVEQLTAAGRAARGCCTDR